MSIALFGRSTLLRFLVVGGTMALVYALFAAIATTHLDWPRAVSSAVVWALCIPLGFWGQRRFAFTDSRPRRFALGFYAATQAMGMAIVACVSYLLARGSFWPDLCVHLLGAALAAGCSYLINRRIIFLRDEAPD